MSLPRVIATGIDTLIATSASVEVPEWLASDLTALQARAKEGKEAIRVIEDDSTPIPLEMLPYGTRAGYRWLLRCPFFTVGLTDSKLLPALKVELGSMVLWTFGAREAVRVVHRVCSELLHDRSPWPLHVSRIDLACDFQGWTPPANFMRCMVTRAVQRRAYVEPFCGCKACGERWATGGRFCYGCGRPADEARQHGPYELAPPEPVGALSEEFFFTGLRYTGSRWGSGKTLLTRLYNKSLEIEAKSPHKRRYMSEVWSRGEVEGRQPGDDQYDPGEPVWRLEPQLRRSMLKSIRNPDVKDENGDPVMLVDTVKEALDHTNSLWHYLVGGDVGEGDKRETLSGWIRLAVPTYGPRGGLLARTLWETHPAWKVFQRTDFRGANRAAPTVRMLREASDTELIARMAHGCAASVASHYDLLSNLTRKLGREPTEQELFNEASEALREFLDDGDIGEAADQLNYTPTARRRVTFVERVRHKDERRPRPKPATKDQSQKRKKG